MVHSPKELCSQLGILTLEGKGGSGNSGSSIFVNNAREKERVRCATPLMYLWYCFAVHGMRIIVEVTLGPMNDGQISLPLYLWCCLSLNYAQTKSIFLLLRVLHYVDHLMNKSNGPWQIDRFLVIEFGSLLGCSRVENECNFQRVSASQFYH